MKKLDFSGDIDFNFKVSKKGRPGKRFLCDELYCILDDSKDDKSQEVRERLKKYSSDTYIYNYCNVSLMPCTGALQMVKQGIGRDRLDTFIWCLAQHYESNENSLLFNHCAATYINSLRSYLNLFENVNEYCKCIYHIDEKLVGELVKSGAKPIDSLDRVSEYLNLAGEFWEQKKKYYEELEERGNYHFHRTS